MKNLIIIVVIAVALYFGYRFYEKKNGSLNSSSNNDTGDNSNNSGILTGNISEPDYDHYNTVLLTYDEIVRNDIEMVQQSALQHQWTINQAVRIFSIYRAKSDQLIPSDYGGSTEIWGHEAFVLETIE